MSKTYNQYCALAMGLDRVGGRWTLLIVRELLVALLGALPRPAASNTAAALISTSPARRIVHPSPCRSATGSLWVR